VDAAVFKDPKTITALIGAQRFIMIWGEPSLPIMSLVSSTTHGYS